MLFSSSAQRWEILKKHVELSIKSQSDTRWESRIKCIKPLGGGGPKLECYGTDRTFIQTYSATSHLIHIEKWTKLFRQVTLQVK